MVREFKSRRPHQKTFSRPGDSGFRSLCREEQLLLRFFGDGSRHLKLEQA